MSPHPSEYVVNTEIRAQEYDVTPELSAPISVVQSNGCPENGNDLTTLWSSEWRSYPCWLRHGLRCLCTLIARSLHKHAINGSNLVSRCLAVTISRTSNRIYGEYDENFHLIPGDGPGLKNCRTSPGRPDRTHHRLELTFEADEVDREYSWGFA